jgi:septum formation inhibitor MinC
VARLAAIVRSGTLKCSTDLKSGGNIIASARVQADGDVHI